MIKVNEWPLTSTNPAWNSSAWLLTVRGLLLPWVWFGKISYFPTTIFTKLIRLAERWVHLIHRICLVYLQYLTVYSGSWSLPANSAEWVGCWNTPVSPEIPAKAPRGRFVFFFLGCGETYLLILQTCWCSSVSLLIKTLMSSKYWEITPNAQPSIRIKSKHFAPWFWYFFSVNFHVSSFEPMIFKSISISKKTFSLILCPPKKK